MFIDELKKTFEGDIATDSETLTKFSHDASIFEVVPKMVIAPRDGADVQAAVKAAIAARATGEQVSLTARAAGTCMSGGSLTESVMIDTTKYLNTFDEVQLAADHKSGSVVTRPGVFYRDLDAQTKRRDLMMPAYPASRELAMVGGMVANNAGGEKTLSYGKIDHYIERLKMVCSDGNEYEFRPLTKTELDAKMQLDTFEGRLYTQLYQLVTANQAVIQAARPQVTKNSAGYYLWNVWDPAANNGQGCFDLTKLIAGSQGTLGIVTEIQFKLVPVPKVSRLVVVFLKDIAKLGDLIAKLHEIKPESLESYDDKTMKLVLRYLPQFMKLLHERNLFSLVRQFIPEFLMVLFRGIPKMVILVEFTGDTAKDVDARVAQASAAIRAFKLPYRVTRNEKETAKYWTMRRESFSLMRNNFKDRHTAPFIDDFAVRAEQLPEFLPKLYAILNKYNFAYGVMGHPGDGNFHILPMLKLEDQNERAIIPQLSEEVYNLVLQYKGTITAEHNDGLVRTPYLEKMFGTEIVQLFEQTKKMFDPENIFNPGKKVGGSIAYAMAHVRQHF